MVQPDTLVGFENKVQHSQMDRVTKSLDNRRQISNLSIKPGNVFVTDFEKSCVQSQHELNSVKNTDKM